MSKLKQYEIDAIINTICDQVLNTNKNKRRDEFKPAEAKLAKLIKQEKEAYAAAAALSKTKQDLTNKLGVELDAYYCNVKNQFVPRVDKALNRFEIRNKLIISLISPDANIEQIIKDMVTDLTK